MPWSSRGAKAEKAKGSVSTAALRLQSDARLVRLARKGSDPAFDALVDRYSTPLLQYCTRLLDAERAQDIVQQAFEKAVRRLRNGEGAEGKQWQVKPWLYRVVHNAAIDELRRTARLAPLKPGAEGAFDNLEHLDRRQRLHAAIDQIGDLPERQRAALLLRELEGYSFKEIAAELDSSVDGVHQLLRRARTKLRNGAGLLIPLPLLRWWSSFSAGAGEGAHRATEAAVAAGGGSGLVKAGVALLAAGAVVAGAAGNFAGKNDRHSSATSAPKVASTSGASESNATTASHKKTAKRKTARGGGSPASTYGKNTPSPTAQGPKHSPSNSQRKQQPEKSSAAPSGGEQTSSNSGSSAPAAPVTASASAGGRLRIDTEPGQASDIQIGKSGTGYSVTERSNDRLSAGPGCQQTSASVLTCGSAKVTTIYVTGGSGSDKLYLDDDVTTQLLWGGGAGDDVVDAGGSGATPSGESANWVSLSGGPGDDRITGGSGGGTWLGGGPGNDVLISASSSQDFLIGDDGNDQLYGYAGTDHMDGGDGDDLLDGGAGQDWMFTGNGADTIVAGDGDADTIYCSSDPSTFKSFDQSDILDASCSP